MKKIKIFVHVNNSLDFKNAEVDETMKIGLLVKEFAPNLSGEQDYLEDVEIYQENQDEDFDKGITILEAGIKHGDHIFIGKCKKVPVNINYAGKNFPTHVGPATTIKKLKELALDHFEISKKDGAELLLWYVEKPLDSRVFIGSLTDYPAHQVDLILAPKKDVNGDLSKDIFQDHLISTEYQSGEIEGRWGEVYNENRPEWPIFFFWIKTSSGEKFNFKFDFSSYPQLAPTSIIWDIDNNMPLTQDKRPNSNKRAIQVFKVWPKQCVYLPCDRIAFEGHPDWPQKHPSLIWNPNEDTFLKYLNELYQILNPEL
jgi:hypothetical protein